MGFRIDKGIFQFKDGDRFINKFKIDAAGTMVEVDPESGDPVSAYLRTGDQATDADTVDGIHAGGFIRSDATDNVTGHTEWQDGYNIRLGNGADFRMWHDGSHTYFRNYNHGNGNIYFQGEDTAGANHALLYMFTANTRPYVSLYEDGGERFKTTSAGVEVLGDAYINQGRIHIKRGTGLTHTEWEDDSSANGRAQLILDSHYSDLIIASRNSNSNKHGSTLTFATQSTSTNDVAKWVIGQGQYEEGADHLAFAYGTNQTNPHSILGTDNAAADFVIMNGGKVVIGGTVDKNAYSTTPTTRLMFGGANTDAESHYYIGTNKEDYGGNYTKLDLRWHTGIRMGARPQYGGIRIFNDEDLGTRIMSIGETDANVRIDNNLWIGGAGGWITDLLNGKLGSTAKAADSDKLDGYHANQLGNRDFTKQGFFVDGDPETYYPVLIGSGTGRYGFNRYSITRHYSSTAPWDPIGTGNHKGGLTFDFYWSGDTAWGGNDKTIRIHQFAENYTTMVGGISLARTGGMIVWLRGGHAYYELHCDALPPSITVYLDGYVDGSGARFDPTTNVDANKHTIWANYPVRGNNDLYHNGDVVATESWVDSNFVKPSESVASATSATTARDLGSYYTADDWFRATGDNNHVKIYGNSRQMLFRTDGTTEAYSGVGGYPFVWTYNGSSSGNRIMILHTDGRLWTNRYGWLDTAFDAAGTGASQAAGVNTRIDDEIVPQITANADAIARNATDIAGKANAGGSYSQDFAADDMRVDQWFRNTVSGKGLYNEATTQHFYSDSDDYWNVAGGTNQNGIRFRDEHGGTIRGYIYANNNDDIGILDAGGSWAIRHDNDNGTYFYTDNETLEFRVGRDAVTGSYGTVQTTTTRSSWGGYSINGQYVFMSDHGSTAGIFNDIDNEWMAIFRRNAEVELMYNGAMKLETTSTGVSVSGNVNATSFSGSGAGLTNLPIPDQSIPVQINGAGGEKLVSMNMNLDMGQIEFTLTNGQTFTAMMGR